MEKKTSSWYNPHTTDFDNPTDRKACQNYLWSLSSEGESQAAGLARELKGALNMGTTKAHIFVSPFKRTIQTAMPYFSGCNGCVNIDPCLAESRVRCMAWTQSLDYEWKTAPADTWTWGKAQETIMKEFFKNQASVFSTGYKPACDLSQFDWLEKANTTTGGVTKYGVNTRAHSFGRYLKSGSFDKTKAVVYSHSGVANEIIRELTGDPGSLKVGQYVVLDRKKPGSTGKGSYKVVRDPRTSKVARRDTEELEESVAPSLDTIPVRDPSKPCIKKKLSYRRSGPLFGTYGTPKTQAASVISFDYKKNAGLVMLDPSDERSSCALSVYDCRGGRSQWNLYCRIKKMKVATETPNCKKPPCKPKKCTTWQTGIYFQQDFRYGLAQSCYPTETAVAVQLLETTEGNQYLTPVCLISFIIVLGLLYRNCASKSGDKATKYYELMQQEV